MIRHNCYRDKSCWDDDTLPSYILELGCRIDGTAPLRVVIFGKRIFEYISGRSFVGWSLKIVRDYLVVCKPDPDFFVMIYELHAEYGAAAEVDIQCPLNLVHAKYPIYNKKGNRVGIGAGIIFAAPLDLEVILRWQYKCGDGSWPSVGLIGVRKGEMCWKIPGLKHLGELEIAREALK
jgi:hypothetical protein